MTKLFKGLRVPLMNRTQTKSSVINVVTIDSRILARKPAELCIPLYVPVL